MNPEIEITAVYCFGVKYLASDDDGNTAEFYMFHGTSGRGVIPDNQRPAFDNLFRGFGLHDVELPKFTYMFVDGAGNSFEKHLLHDIAALRLGQRDHLTVFRVTGYDLTDGESVDVEQLACFVSRATMAQHARPSPCASDAELVAEYGPAEAAKLGALR